MAHFLLFAFVFAGQLIGGLMSTLKLPPPNDGDTISILSIDGGGIKGIVPARVLDHLDKALKAKDPNTDLAHYFDVIAGTSTGGLIAAMLATPSPNNSNRPGFTPIEIVQFYKENGPHIFNKSSSPVGPEFTGVFLHNKIRELLKETRLNEALTNVVIPTFDMKKQKPVIFSNYKLKTLPYLNAKMSDICIGTSAAPSQLPPYYFRNDNIDFDLIDGGITAGNPTQVAIREAIQHNKYSKIQVLSLGNGVTKVEEKWYFSAIVATFWPNELWQLFALQFLGRASRDMTEYYLGTTISHLPAQSSYLRIEEYNLDPSLDNATNVSQENLDGLEELGKELLKKNVVKMNVDTFDIEETGEGTNAEALDRLAELLYEERQQRLRKKSMEKEEDHFLKLLGSLLAEPKQLNLAVL